MRVLLPPSEGKAHGAKGAPLDLARLSLPGLTSARETVLEELTALCNDAPEKARDVLGLSERQGSEVAKNTALRSAPALPAGELYTGVLYDALDLPTLSAAARARGEENLLVFSGLWGAVRITDRVPSYRCSGGVRLPALGGLGAFWRGPLDTVLPDETGEGLILDLRSAAYGGMWKPKGPLGRRTATVRVLQSTVVDGVEKRRVVSHFNKATKGRIVRTLLESGAEPRNRTELVATLRSSGYRVEGDPETDGRLDVIVSDL